jgi:hypothetical protein
LPRLAERVAMPLERANATYQMGQVGASVIGPLLAGVLIVAISAANVMYLDAASFFISAAIIAAGVTAPSRAAADASAARSPFAGIGEALRFVRQDQLILLFVGISIAANFMFTPLFAVVFPVYAKNVFDSATALGVLEAAFGAGSVLTTIAYGVMSPRLRRFPVLAVCMLIGASGVWILPLSSTLALSATAGFVIGAGLGPVNVLTTTVMQERVPEQMMGRVLGLMFASSQLATPAGVLLAGFLIAGIGVRAEMLVIAAGFSAVVIFGLLHPHMRGIDRPTNADQIPAATAG